MSQGTIALLSLAGLAAGMSALHHSRQGAVAYRMALGVGLASAGAVALVSHFVVTQPWYDATAFQLLFAIVLLVVVGRMVGARVRPSSEKRQPEAPSVPQWGRWLGTGTTAGTVAATVGVGGGVVLVPVYSRLLQVSFHRAVGTSSATIVVISVLSVLGYVALGGGVAHRPPFALGYVDVGTGLLLAVPAMADARGGAALAHHVNTTVLRWSFAVLAVGVAGRLLWNALGLG